MLNALEHCAVCVESWLKVQEDQEPLSAVVPRGLQGIGGVCCSHMAASPVHQASHNCPVFFHHSFPYTAAPPALLAVSVYAIKSLLRLCYKKTSQNQMSHVNAGINMPCFTSQTETNKIVLPLCWQATLLSS